MMEHTDFCRAMYIFELTQIELSGQELYRLVRDVKHVISDLKLGYVSAEFLF